MLEIAERSKISWQMVPDYQGPFAEDSLCPPEEETPICMGCPN